MTGLFREAGFDSPDAWEDDLAHSLDADHLVRLKTSLGASKPRFDGLSRRRRPRAWRKLVAG